MVQVFILCEKAIRGLAMKRRIIKKRLRDQKQPGYCLKGNKGGDFVHFVPMKDNRVYILSGCSCVISLNAIVPNEFLSILIEKCILKYGSVENFIMSTTYDETYKRDLISKII